VKFRSLSLDEMIYRLADELRILGKSGKRAFIRAILEFILL